MGQNYRWIAVNTWWAALVSTDSRTMDASSWAHGFVVRVSLGAARIFVHRDLVSTMETTAKRKTAIPGRLGSRFTNQDSARQLILALKMGGRCLGSWLRMHSQSDSERSPNSGSDTG